MPNPTRPEAERIVREACVRANPGLMCARCPYCGEECGRAAVGELCLQCSNGTLYDAVATPGAADVLLALGEAKLPWPLFIDTEGFVWEGVGPESWKKIAFLDLRATLSGWSDEAVAALAKLLTKNV